MSKINLTDYLKADPDKVTPEVLGYDPVRLVKTMIRGVSLNSPFFGTFVTTYPIVILEGDHPLIPTAATDGYAFYFNGLFLKLLNPTMDTKNYKYLYFLLYHEILHLVLESTARKGNRDSEVWNHATDYAINGILVEMGENSIEMPPMSLFKDAIKGVINSLSKEQLEVTKKLWEGVEFYPDEAASGLYDSRFSGMTAEEIYDILIEEYKNKKDSGKKGAGFDIHILGHCNTKEEAEEVSRIIRNAITTGEISQNSSRGRGSLPKGIQRLINNINEPKVHWSQYILSEFNDMRPSDYTDQVHDSRYFGQGITLPGIDTESVCKICFMVDTSASLGQNDLIDALTELYGITSEFDFFEIDVFSCDTGVYNYHSYNNDNGNDILKYPFKGGGGTMFEPAFQYAEELQRKNSEPYDALIYFTDGYGESWCEEYNDKFKKVIWLLNRTSSAKPPWGTVIRYDKYDVKET